jgi:hypothetical protein
MYEASSLSRRWPRRIRDTALCLGQRTWRWRGHEGLRRELQSQPRWVAVSSQSAPAGMLPRGRA